MQMNTVERWRDGWKDGTGSKRRCGEPGTCGMIEGLRGSGQGEGAEMWWEVEREIMRR